VPGGAQIVQGGEKNSKGAATPTLPAPMAEVDMEIAGRGNIPTQFVAIQERDF